MFPFLCSGLMGNSGEKMRLVASGTLTQANFTGAVGSKVWTANIAALGAASGDVLLVYVPYNDSGNPMGATGYTLDTFNFTNGGYESGIMYRTLDGTEAANTSRTFTVRTAYNAYYALWRAVLPATSLTLTVKQKLLSGTGVAGSGAANFSGITKNAACKGIAFMVADADVAGVWTPPAICATIRAAAAGFSAIVADIRKPKFYPNGSAISFTTTGTTLDQAGFSVEFT